MTQIQVMPPRVALADPRTGLISREWYLFLLRDFERGTETAGLVDGFDARIDAVEADTLSLDARADALEIAASSLDSRVDALEAVGPRELPVGALHISVTPTNPAATLGYGTWGAFGTGRVLVGVDVGDPDFDTVEETGGSKTATI